MPHQMRILDRQCATAGTRSCSDAVTDRRGAQYLEAVWRFDIEPGLLGLCDQHAVTSQSAQDAVNESVEQALQYLLIWRGHRVKSGSAAIQCVDAVQDQHVEVNVEVEGAAEALYQCDDTGAGAA